MAAHNELVAFPERCTPFCRSGPSLPRKSWIADDGSSDGTAGNAVRRIWIECPTVDSDAALVRVGSTKAWWLVLSHRGKSVPWNGVLSTSADVTVTVDVDTVPDRTATDALKGAFTAERAGVARTGVINSRRRTGRCHGVVSDYEHIRNFLARYAWMQVGCP